MIKYKFNTIEEAIADIRNGKMVVVVDDEDRENEGDLVIAAEKVTPSIVNFMAKHAGGLICLPIIRERVEGIKCGTDGCEKYRPKPDDLYGFDRCI